MFIYVVFIILIRFKTRSLIGQLIHMKIDMCGTFCSLFCFSSPIIEIVVDFSFQSNFFLFIIFMFTFCFPFLAAPVLISLVFFFYLKL